jgi:Zn-dependent oligopeptidase
MISAINVPAMEPLDMKRVTDTDKMYFGSRLTQDQLEKLQQISTQGFTTSKLPCEKIAAINKTLNFINSVTPVLREAATNSELSGYARKYSSSLALEFTETTKVFAVLLPRYKKICSESKQNRQDAELLIK